jgi:hypothetical protein
MSSSSASVSLNLTPVGLFPGMKSVEKDPKCQIISKVLVHLTQNCNMSGVTQSSLQQHAMKRYSDLSEETRMTLPQADHAAFLLYEKGVPVEIAQKYYSFKLSAADAGRWQIVLV